MMPEVKALTSWSFASTRRLSDSGFGHRQREDDLESEPGYVGQIAGRTLTGARGYERVRPAGRPDRFTICELLEHLEGLQKKMP